MGSNMMEQFELKSFKKDNKTYWYMVSTLGKNADSLLHKSQLVLFREGQEDICLTSKGEDCELKQKIDNKNNASDLASSSPEKIKNSYQAQQWYCRFYIGDKEKLIKEAPRACTVILEKFQAPYQLFIKDKKGNSLSY